MEMGAGELNSAAAETYLAAFDCLDARVEGVLVRDRDAPRHLRHTSTPNTPVLDRFLRNSFGVSRPVRRAQPPDDSSRP
jgi:hypothetical protein